MRQGFGTVQQSIMRNPCIPLQAKGLYGYLSSIAGADGECYPSINTITQELGITKDTYYKHLQVLIDNKIICKSTVRNKGKFGSTLYKILPYPKNSETNKSETIKSDTDISNTNNYSAPFPKNYDSPFPNFSETTKNSIQRTVYKEHILCKSTDADALFEKLWKLYPNKKGKGRVSKTQKQKLLKIGYDEMSRTIDRYKDGLSKDDWRKPQNGSTFFNSGYVDYLDKNYENGKGGEGIGGTCNQGGGQAADFYERFLGACDSD